MALRFADLVHASPRELEAIFDAKLADLLEVADNAELATDVRAVALWDVAYHLSEIYRMRFDQELLVPKGHEAVVPVLAAAESNYVEAVKDGLHTLLWQMNESGLDSKALSSLSSAMGLLAEYARKTR